MENQFKSQLKVKAGSVLSYGWDVLWDKFMTLFLITLVIWVAYIPLSIMDEGNSHSFVATVLGTFSLLYIIFLIRPLKFSANYMYLKAIRNNRFDVKELFDVFNNYLNVVLAGLLQLAIIGFGLAFLIVPGIIFACRLTFVPYLVMDKKLDPVKAVEESWRLTKGQGWRIFWMYIVSFFLFIAGLIVLIFGAVIALMWINAAFAGLYQAVLEQHGEYSPESIEADINAPLPTEETEQNEQNEQAEQTNQNDQTI